MDNINNDNYDNVKRIKAAIVKSETRAITTCQICGIRFEYYIATRPNIKTCSNECLYKLQSKLMSGDKHPRWKGGMHPKWRGSNWKKVRLLALERDNNVCQDCLTKSKLVVHHLKPYRKFNSWVKANKLENLITLCKSCHAKRESSAPDVPKKCLPDPKRERGKYFNCLKCNKKFWRKPSDIKNGENKYCSRYCSNTRKYKYQTSLFE